MKLLFDESVPRQLGVYFPDRIEVQTAQRMGWAGSKNGDLFAAGCFPRIRCVNHGRPRYRIPTKPRKSTDTGRRDDCLTNPHTGTAVACPPSGRYSHREYAKTRLSRDRIARHSVTGKWMKIPPLTTSILESTHKDRLASRPWECVSQIHYSAPAQEVRSV